jgi:hypothetical protein
LWTADSKGVVERDIDPASATEAAIDAGIATGASFTVTIGNDERWLIIAGHEDWLTCTVALEWSRAGKVFDLVGSTEPGERNILLGGQWVDWPRRLLVARDLVERAALTFRSSGKLDGDLGWQRQV